MSKRIAIIVTTHDRLGDTGRSTGYYLEEVAVPYRAFTHAGYDVDLASVTGGAAPADPNGMKAAEVPGSPSTHFSADATAQAKIDDTIKVASLDPTDYDAVWVAGGHGAMWDLPDDAELARLVGAMFDAGKVVAAVCHGPAGIVGARRADGASILSGRRVTGFTTAEEKAVKLSDVVPFLLEERMSELGGAFVAGGPWADHAVRDGKLITGQNPQSTASTAHLVLQALAE